MRVKKRPADFPVNKVRCATCPFNEHGVRSIREKVEVRCLTEGSQFCHHTNNKTLCRGARDFQLQIFYRLGVLKEQTDACWDETQAALAAKKKGKG